MTATWRRRGIVMLRWSAAPVLGADKARPIDQLLYLIQPVHVLAVLCAHRLRIFPVQVLGVVFPTQDSVWFPGAMIATRGHAVS